MSLSTFPGSTASGTTLRIRRFAPNLGATISGLDLRGHLGAEARALLRRALLDHGVLFFREQELTPEQLLEVASIFGTPLRHNPYLPSRRSAPSTPCCAPTSRRCPP